MTSNASWSSSALVNTAARSCWLHKTGNVLNKLPRSLQAKAKGHLQNIWMAEIRDQAEAALEFFLEAYGAKYDKAAASTVPNASPGSSTASNSKTEKS